MRSPKLMPRFARVVVAALGLVAISTAAAPGWGPYVVKSGDNLWSLARAHHTTVQALEAQNHLHGSTIYTGEVLTIPGLGGKPATAVPHRTAIEGGSAVYVVRSGDTLTAIARTRRTTIATLASLNHLSGRMVIDVGQRLRVPAPRQSVVIPRAETSASRSGAAQVANARDPGAAAIRSMVIAEAARQHLSPALAQAIATQESGFRMRIVSPTGAVGVMQLEPATAAWLSGMGHGTIDPYNLEQNIAGGVMLLKLLGTETANANQQIAAYYEGLGAVRGGHMYDGAAQYVADVTALERRYA